MATGREEALRVKEINAPSSAKVRAAANQYIGQADMTHGDLAERVGYSAVTVRKFLNDVYASVAGDDIYVRSAIWDFIERHPIESGVRAKGQLFETENFRHIERYFKRATEQSEWVLLYGPPGTQKTFALEHLICAQNRANKRPAIYVYASAEMSPVALLKRIGRDLTVSIRSATRERLVTNILNAVRCLDEVPAIVIDEAQHLDVDCLETIRELHDRGGCGIVLAGSHMLFQSFTTVSRRGHLEQLLSRIDHRDELPGLQENEVREIAEHALGKKLSDKLARAFVAQCRVDDIFAARESRGYLSVRRLVKLIAQYKAKSREAA